jgi:hypothetical protein
MLAWFRKYAREKQPLIATTASDAEKQIATTLASNERAKQAQAAQLPKSALAD